MSDLSIYPWLQSQWQQLQVAWQTQRMPHALLLSGPAGLGKNIFAQLLAKYLLCEKAEQQALNDCSCHQCQLFNAHNHPDYFTLKPEGDSKVIKIEQVRELIAAINQTAHYQGYQVVVITPAEALNAAAANALLKTLEEPPGKVIFILICQQASFLPATIRSRCQLIMFKVPAVALAASWLQPQLAAAMDAEQLLKQAEGAPLAALALAQSNAVNQAEQLLKVLWQLKVGEANPITVAASYAKENVVTCINTFISLLMDLIRFKHIGNQQHNVTQQNLLVNLAQKISAIKLFQLLDFLTERKKLAMYHNGINMQLLCEEIFIKWVMEI